SVFKGLLFLGAGTILHSSGLRDLNEMGGLIRRMPNTAFYFLIGALAISALPPLNGFVSEWLTFQTALQAPLLEHGVMRSLVPLFAASLALAAALTAMCFVKVYGIAFLGQPREARHATPAPGGGHDAGALERIGMAWLAAGCFVLGLLPGTFVQMLDRVSVSLSGGGLPAEALESSWLWLVPTAAEQASYSPVIFLSVIVAATLLAFLLLRGFYHGRVRYADPWDCGYPEQSPRMQDTADAFGQPIRHVFGPLYLMKRHLPAADDPAPRYSVQIEDRHWYLLYLPILLPYYTLAKLFHKDAVMAREASPLFRLTPYVLFGCMWLAAGIVPVLATELPFAPAADIIALVGVFALARVFAALAAMDIGTPFGGLGARREMLIGFLAEPAMLMTLFTAAFISGSTQLTTIVETLAHRDFAIY